MGQKIQDILTAAEDITKGVQDVKKDMDKKNFTGVSDPERTITITLDGLHRVHKVSVAKHANTLSPEALSEKIQTALEEVMMHLEHAEREAFNGMMQDLDLLAYANKQKEEDK
jgi:DNA-binding protein YbaB